MPRSTAPEPSSRFWCWSTIRSSPTPITAIPIPQSFLGFDGVVLFTDSFFMSAMFFLSGLFVWPSLQRKGIGWFLRDRWWRLGLPFIVAALILMPVAYYAVELRQQDISFAAFWWKTVTVGPGQADRPGSSGCCWRSMCSRRWCTGPRPASSTAIGRLSLASHARPGLFFRALLIGSILVYRAGGALLRCLALVHDRTRRHSGEPHPALCAVFLRRHRHRRGAVRPGPAGRRWRAGAALAGLADDHAR